MWLCARHTDAINERNSQAVELSPKRPVQNQIKSAGTLGVRHVRCPLPLPGAASNQSTLPQKVLRLKGKGTVTNCTAHCDDTAFPWTETLQKQTQSGANYFSLRSEQCELVTEVSSNTSSQRWPGAGLEHLGHLEGTGAAIFM